MNLSITERVRFRLAIRLPVKPARARRRRGAVTICFDDVPKGACSLGASILEDHGCRGTYFVAGGLCGQRIGGVAMFDDDDLQTLHERGHEIGCHTFGHESVLRLGRDGLRSSLDRNAGWLRDRLGDVRMASFAYPYGHMSLPAKRVCSGRFAACRSVAGALNGDCLDLAALEAIGLERRRDGDYDPPRLIERAALERAWLILYSHDVADRPSDYGCRPSDLDRILGLAKAAGLDVLTLKDALAQGISDLDK